MMAAADPSGQNARSSRVLPGVLVVLAIFAVLVANAAEIWCLIARDSDPRVTFGEHAVILHNRNGAGEVVLRSPNGEYHEFNYRIIAFGSWIVAGSSIALAMVFWSNRKVPERQRIT